MKMMLPRTKLTRSQCYEMPRFVRYMYMMQLTCYTRGLFLSEQLIPGL